MTHMNHYETAHQFWNSWHDEIAVDRHTKGRVTDPAVIDSLGSSYDEKS